MIEPRVVVTGVGLQTPLGSDPAQVWAQLLTGATAARVWPDLEDEGFPVSAACRIEGDLGEPDLARRGRAMARLAANDALLDMDVGAQRDVGVYVGTTMGESAAFEAARDYAELNIDEAAGHVFAREIANTFRVSGPRRTYGTACAAGNYAIGAASAAIRNGEVHAALAGGVDPFSRIALLGFARTRAMAADVCRPFDAARTGMQLGEAAAFVLLEAEDRASARGATPMAVLGGLGLSGDAYHPTAPREDGSGMAAAMRGCLEVSGVRPEDVGLVLAHGTGTRLSDAAEARALHSVFGSEVPPVTSLKGALGHALGAATAVQAVVATLALHDSLLPPTANHLAADPALDVDVVRAAQHTTNLRWVMSCGYAFGGLNSALMVGLP